MKTRRRDGRKLCRHGMAICPECISISDPAKRMADIINGYVTFIPVWELRTKWIAIRLQDGGSDGNLYDSREEAIRHQLDERFCAYVCMGAMMQGAKPLDCAIYLEVHRQAYDSGMRLHEPEAPQLIMSTSAYDRIIGKKRYGATENVRQALCLHVSQLFRAMTLIASSHQADAGVRHLSIRKTGNRVLLTCESWRVTTLWRCSRMSTLPHI